ncbi:DUF4411 family protein [Sediminibacterium roseum]|uniref:DUF4411 family protein n=1 Tax=Sediminibacterium roseum TaxID=1978412 RepID=A0ABW9ZRB1_9BACT|nr:DUF4411 family protein [Sediminibacterium roseum]NCI48997.1 DUF4411 family protein [Sediminibacterium roseum]
MPYNPPNIYCIDSSAFITMHRYYPKRIMPDLWNNIDNLFKEGRIISHEFVFDEIVNDSDQKDELSKFIQPYKDFFGSITQSQLSFVQEIVTLFPKLIDVNCKKDQADPWIISLMLEIITRNTLFGSNDHYILVSAESENSDFKIPAVCKHYNIRHLNVFEFFEDNGWSFNMTSS